MKFKHKPTTVEAIRVEKILSFVKKGNVKNLPKWVTNAILDKDILTYGNCVYVNRNYWMNDDWVIKTQSKNIKGMNNKSFKAEFERA